MRSVRLLVTGIGALILAGCPGPTAPRQIGVSGGGGTGRVLVFIVEPSNTVAGTIIAPAVQVAVEDTLGAVDTTATGGVTLSLTTPAGATLSGTNPQTLASGIAIFSDLSVNQVGTYTLTATSSGRTSSTSTAFNITAAP
jgi:hypothetical protein